MSLTTKISFAFGIVALLVFVVACRRSGSVDAHALTPATQSRYKAGQVWSFHSPADQPKALLTVLRVETNPKLGTIVHVALSGVNLPNNGTNVQHMPFSEQAIDRSVISLVRSDEPLPDFTQGYNQWRHAFESGQGGVFTVTVTEGFEVIREALRRKSSQPDQ